MTDNSAARLSAREEAALSVLADLGCPVGGGGLAQRMSNNERGTSTAAAHQAANRLVMKGLAIKGYLEGGLLIRYEITNAGRAEAQKREAATAAGEENANA